MKILYIGHGHENTGWSKAYIDYALAMDSAGLDVVCRSIKLNNSVPNLPTIILELEQKSSKGCDIVISHILPHFLDYDGHFKKNIALFIAETYNLKYTGWPARLNTMDEVWIPNSDMLITCNNSWITPTIKIVPHACDVRKFDKEYPEYKLPDQIKTRYKFYFIGENIRRKHLITALVAYYSTFSRHDDVALIIKTNKSGMYADQCMQEVQGQIAEIKHAMRMYGDNAQYPPECVITNHLTDDEICSLHQQCDCFLNPSFGEAFSLPTFDSIGFGNDAISSNCGGMKDFLQGIRTGHLVDGSIEPVIGYEKIFDDMHTGHDEWYNVSTTKFGQAMWNCYINRNKYYGIERNYGLKEHINQYSYQTIGNHIKELLSE